MDTRTRADILEDLADARHSAGRMTYADPDYPLVHLTINALLDELDHLTAHPDSTTTP